MSGWWHLRLYNPSCPWPKMWRSRRRTLKSVKIAALKMGQLCRYARNMNHIQWFKSQYPTQNPKPFTNQCASISVCPGHLKPVWQRHVLTQPLKSSLAHYAYDRWHVQTHWAANTWPSTPQNKNIHTYVHISVYMYVPNSRASLRVMKPQTRQTINLIYLIPPRWL